MLTEEILDSSFVVLEEFDDLLRVNLTLEFLNRIVDFLLNVFFLFLLGVWAGIVGFVFVCIYGVELIDVDVIIGKRAGPTGISHRDFAKPVLIDMSE